MPFQLFNCIMLLFIIVISLSREELIIHKTLLAVEAVMGADDNPFVLEGHFPSKSTVIEALEAKPVCNDKLPNTKNNKTRKSRTTATNFVNFIMSHLLVIN